MSRLRIFDDHAPDAVKQETTDGSEIASLLGERGIRFERWEASQPIAPGATQDEVIAAYRGDIDRLMAEEGYITCDVVSLDRDHPQKTEFRNKFLNEHTHGEDEVRFFVAGSGLFTLHLGNEVYETLCEKGDLIRVPAGTKHWFDMGPNPYFVAIRLFNNPAGWVANFTGSDYATQFPRLEN